MLPDGANAYVTVYFLSVLVILAAPAIIGIFWGAPLIARELETGTCRLAWNQSITRTRWLAVKLTLIGVAAMAVTEALSLLQAWWAAPIGKAVGLGGSASLVSEGRFGYFVFPSHGITPLGYAAFGFALGVTAGLLIRRAIPAMAVTLAIFAAVQVATPLWIRPHLVPAQPDDRHDRGRASELFPTGGSDDRGHCHHVAGQPGAWITSSGAVNATGQPVTAPAACESALPRVLGGGGSATLGQLPGQPRHPGGRELPARQPLLAPPVGRDRALPGPRPGPGRALLLAARPPPVLMAARDEPALNALALDALASPAVAALGDNQAPPQVPGPPNNGKH